jgi:heptosyltransferase-2
MNGKKPVFFIVKNRALGDSIMGLSSVQYLRELYPESTIIYAVPEWIAPLYQNVQTAADRIYPLKTKSLSDIFDLYTDLINLKVDAIHEMHLSGRGQKIFSLFSFLKRIPFTYHNHHLKGGTQVHDQGVIKELIQRDLDGVYSFYGKAGKIPNFLNYPPVMKIKKAIVKKKTIIMGVVATRKTKMWPLENYLKLARLIGEKHPDYQILIPLSKGHDDLKIKKELNQLGVPLNTTIVHWPLAQLADEFTSAKFYVGNDTGLKHLAVAAGIKTYTFFGPEPANEWHPYDAQKHPYYYLQGLACRTRTHHYCGLSVCDLKAEYMQCLKVFTPEDIIKDIEVNF